MKKKIGVLSAVTFLLISMFSISAFAATDTSSWNVNYTPGAPSGSANPVNYLYVESSVNRFYAKCSNLTGASGKIVTIKCQDFPNHVGPFYFHDSGYDATFKTPVTADSVGFKVVISGPGSCSSNGYILGL